MAEISLESQFQAIAEGNQKKDQSIPDVDDAELVSAFQSMHMEAEDAFRPIKDLIDAAWNAYNNNFDFSDKDDSESQAFLPIYKTAIRVAQNLVRKSLLQAPQYFTVDGLNDETRELEEDIYQTLFRAAEQSDLRIHVANAAFGAFIENLATLKLWPVQLGENEEKIHPAQRYRIAIDPISLQDDLRLDPKGRNLYLLHRSEMDLADYETLVDQGHYTKASLEAAKTDFVAKEEEFRKNEHEGMTETTKPAWRKQVELWECWTRALCREDGTAKARNVYFTILNRQHVARKAYSYPYEHGKPPFVISPIADRPFSVYHENFGESVLGMLDAIIDLFNSLITAAQNTATKGFEVSVDQVRNPGELRTGFYGGKVVKTTSLAQPGLSVVRPFDVGSFSPEAYQFFVFLLQQFQNGIGITELLTGVPGIGEKTATEIESKTRAAMAQINQVAILLEQHLVAPALRMIFDLLLEWNPEVFGDRVAFQTPKHALKLKIKVQGISGTIEREGELQKLLFVVKTLMGSPAATKLNWDYVSEQLILRNGFNPSDLLNQQVTAPMAPGSAPPPPEVEENEANRGKLIELLQMAQPK